MSKFQEFWKIYATLDSLATFVCDDHPGTLEKVATRDPQVLPALARIIADLELLASKIHKQITEDYLSTVSKAEEPTT